MRRTSCPSAARTPVTARTATTSDDHSPAVRPQPRGPRRPRAGRSTSRWLRGGTRVAPCSGDSNILSPPVTGPPSLRFPRRRACRLGLRSGFAAPRTGPGATWFTPSDDRAPGRVPGRGSAPGRRAPCTRRCRGSLGGRVVPDGRGPRVVREDPPPVPGHVVRARADQRDRRQPVAGSLPAEPGLWPQVRVPAPARGGSRSLIRVAQATAPGGRTPGGVLHLWLDVAVIRPSEDRALPRP